MSVSHAPAAKVLQWVLSVAGCLLRYVPGDDAWLDSVPFVI
ncbi:hypothetical protein ABIB34_001760 [Rhodococcus sp. UYP5]